MTNYPSSRINGAAPGVQSVNNITNNLEVKDTVRDAQGNPLIANATQLIEDFKLVLDGIASDIDNYNAVSTSIEARLATAAALPAGTYANGTAGVGATFTASAVGALTVDGVAVALNDVILVKNQVAGLQNGLYYVSVLGTGGVAFVLTRITGFDTSAEMIYGTPVHVDLGTANADKTFVLTNSSAVTVGTTALTFSAFTTSVTGDADTQRKAYIAAQCASKINNLSKELLTASYHLNKLFVDVQAMNIAGIPAVGRYPSDKNRNW